MRWISRGLIAVVLLACMGLGVWASEHARGQPWLGRWIGGVTEHVSGPGGSETLSVYIMAVDRGSRQTWSACVPTM